jgi:hypothetical protein
MNHPGVRFHLIAITSNKSSKQITGTYAVLKDGIYVTSEGFKLWNQKEISLRQLTNWWKTRGFFQVIVKKYFKVSIIELTSES